MNRIEKYFTIISTAAIASAVAATVTYLFLNSSEELEEDDMVAISEDSYDDKERVVTVEYINNHEDSNSGVTSALSRNNHTNSVYDAIEEDLKDFKVSNKFKLLEEELVK